MEYALMKEAIAPCLLQRQMMNNATVAEEPTMPPLSITTPQLAK
ncbi:MAG TPA: hypothetical protein V6D37_01175 [Candidatus Sericytochromatia bacterium]